MKVVYAERYAPGAIDALNGLSEGGHVLATYRRAMNLRTRMGRLLTLQIRGTPVGPFGIVIQANDPLAWPRPETPCSLTGQYLSIGALLVDLGYMRLSQAPAIPALDDGWSTARAIDLLGPYASRSAIPTWDVIGKQADDAHPLSRTLLYLGAAVRHHTNMTEDVAFATSRLVGWGQGATPSGDDFLMGFLGSWIRLSPSDSPSPTFLDTLTNIATQATTPLAAEFYVHLAQGRLSEPVDLLLHAVALADQERIRTAALELASFGASSGHDTIAGVLWYLQARTCLPVSQKSEDM